MSQPFASLLLHGQKTIETRNNQMFEGVVRAPPSERSSTCPRPCAHFPHLGHTHFLMAVHFHADFIIHVLARP